MQNKNAKHEFTGMWDKFWKTLSGLPDSIMLGIFDSEGENVFEYARQLNNAVSAVNNMEAIPSDICFKMADHARTAYSSLNDYIRISDNKALREVLNSLQLLADILFSIDPSLLKYFPRTSKSSTQKRLDELQAEKIKEILLQAEDIKKLELQAEQMAKMKEQVEKLISEGKIRDEVVQEKADAQLGRIEKRSNELRLVFTDVLGEEGEEGERYGGLKKQLEDAAKDFSNFAKLEKAKIQKLREDAGLLVDQATVKGLSESYSEMKESFRVPIIWWGILFFCSLACMLGLAFYKNGDIADWETAPKKLLGLLPLLFPLIWTAMFSAKKQSENRRLQQEYAHKETLAKSYQSYKQQIEELGDDDQELLHTLIENSIKTIAYNASETLDKQHDQKTPIQEIVAAVAAQQNIIGKK